MKVNRTPPFGPDPHADVLLADTGSANLEVERGEGDAEQGFQGEHVDEADASVYAGRSEMQCEVVLQPLWTEKLPAVVVHELRGREVRRVLGIHRRHVVEIDRQRGPHRGASLAIGVRVSFRFELTPLLTLTAIGRALALA